MTQSKIMPKYYSGGLSTQEVLVETTFENPTVAEIQQISKNEPKPSAEKKED